MPAPVVQSDMCTVMQYSAGTWSSDVSRHLQRYLEMRSLGVVAPSVFSNMQAGGVTSHAERHGGECRIFTA